MIFILVLIYPPHACRHTDLLTGSPPRRRTGEGERAGGREREGGIEHARKKRKRERGKKKREHGRAREKKKGSRKKESQEGRRRMRGVWVTLPRVCPGPV